MKINAYSRIFAAVVALGMGLAYMAHAATPIYVNAAMADDSGDGLTLGTAKKYIGSGITLVEAGGTVYVAAGTYKEQLNITKGVTIIGDVMNPDNVVIDGENKTTLSSYGQVRIYNPSGDVVFEGFKIVNGGRRAVDSDYFAILTKGGFSRTIQNCKIIGHGASAELGCDYGVWAYTGTGALVLRNNYLNAMYHAILLEQQYGAATIQGNTFDALYTGEMDGSVYGGRAIEIINYGSTDVTSLQKISGNLFTNFVSTGVQISGGFSGQTPRKFTNVLIENNDFNFSATAITNLNGAIHLKNVSGTLNDSPTGGVAAAISNNFIHVPSGNGIWIKGLNGNIVCHNNYIAGNSGCGIKASESLGTPVDASFNWWGSARGPAITSNPGGDGDAVSTNVIYRPWVGFGTDTSPDIGFQPAVAPVTITLQVSPAGSGVAGGACITNIGDLVQLSATANVNWTFAGWSDGDLNGTRTITAPVGGAVYTANFRPSWQNPDFAIAAITTVPAILTPGCSFTATVMVVNYGLSASDAGVMRLWLDHPAAAASREAGGVQLPVGTLAVGGITNIIFTGLTATNATGTFNLRAFVDADNTTTEVSEGNNQSTLTYTFASGGGYVGQPDFAIAAITTVPAMLTPGCAFTATVMVVNYGLSAADAGMLRLWLDHPAAATNREAGDVQLPVGTMALGGITNIVFTGLTATNATGTFNLRAFVDADNATPEQSEGNNQSTLTYTFASGGGGYGYTGKPDFTIAAITTEPVLLTPGCAFTATVMVVNYGLSAGDAGVLRLWLDHPAAATNREAGGVELPVGALALGGITNIVFTGLTATNATGTFNLRAFVDADNATTEQSEGDNQLTLTYTFAPGGGGSGYTGKPDFAITAITTEPAMLTPGCAFTATVALVNYGLAAGDAGVLRIWLDHPAAATNLEAGGVELPVGALALGGTTNIIFTGLTATNATGTFNLRAFVDADNATPELSEGNNQSVMTYTFAPGGGGSGYTGKPDFAITAITTEPAMLTPGCAFTATVAVVNYGLAAGDAGVLRMWLDHPAAATNLEAGGVELPVGVLALGGITNIIFTGLTATNATGTFNLRAFVDADNATPELSEGNNQSTLTYTFAPGGGGSFDPGANSWSRPDFTVTELAFVGAAPSLAGEPFTVRVTVANRGLVAGNGGTLYLFASKADWALPGSEAGADTNLTVGVLAAGGERTFDVQLPTPSARGVHHLRAYVVSPETEWSTGDNQSSITYGLQTVQVSIAVVPGVGVVVTWNNYWGDTYTVYRKVDPGTFEPLATNIPSARPAEQNVFIDANPPAGGAALYKVGASVW